MIYQNELRHSACDQVVKIILWNKISQVLLNQQYLQNLPYNVYQTSIWKNVSPLVKSSISECCQPLLCRWFSNSVAASPFSPGQSQVWVSQWHAVTGQAQKG